MAVGAARGGQVLLSKEQRGSWDPCLRASLDSRRPGLDQVGQMGNFFLWIEGVALQTLLGFCFLPPGRGGWQSWLQALSLEFAISIKTQDERNT